MNTETPVLTGIYHGQVIHKRFAPVKHRLAYKVFSLLMPLADIEMLSKDLWCFSHNKFNIISFHDSDHGARDGSSVQAFVKRTFAEAGIAPAEHDILINCYPRILGYAFNPLTTYFALAKDGSIAAMLYEVSNTFGEHTFYLIPTKSNRNQVIAQSCRKAFHVSPFNKQDGDYGFRVSVPGDTLSIGVSLRQDDTALLNAYFSGERRPLTAKGLVKAVLRQPLMTWKVIAGIHLEALRLWFKGLKLNKKPKFKGLRVHGTRGS